MIIYIYMYMSLNNQFSVAEGTVKSTFGSEAERKEAKSPLSLNV